MYYSAQSIDRMLDDWHWLSTMFNRVNGAMGQSDLYPFGISEPVVATLALDARTRHSVDRFWAPGHLIGVRRRCTQSLPFSRREVAMNPPTTNGPAMFAYDYPLLGAFFSVLYFTLFFMWIWIAVTVFIDIFRSHDMNGWVKALWLLFVILIPFLGVFVYLIARGGKMAEHRQKDIEKAQTQFNQAVQQAAPVDTAGQLEKLADLKSQGVLTDEEFTAQKAKLLA